METELTDYGIDNPLKELTYSIKQKTLEEGVAFCLIKDSEVIDTAIAAIHKLEQVALQEMVDKKNELEYMEDHKDEI
jgi:hypothetical protein